MSECYEPHPEHAAAEIIDGDAVIINLATGVYYSLSGVAGAIWRKVTERTGVPSIVDEIVASYAVDPAQAAADVHRVLGQLAAEGVIRRIDAAVEPGESVVRAAGPPPPSRAPYVAPDVQIYRDMQDLLALDPPSPGLNGVVWKRSTDRA